VPGLALRLSLRRGLGLRFRHGLGLRFRRGLRRGLLRLLGVYFVRYADPQAEIKREDDGLLGRLAFWRDDRPKVKAEQYRVSVTAADEASRVRVLDASGAAETSPTARRILALLHEQLK
jgi:outer membrane protein assembly factor BamC